MVATQPSEEVTLLEWRLEQLEAALEDAQAARHADLGRLAREAEAREGLSARIHELEESLVDARQRAESLAERLQMAERARADFEHRLRDAKHAHRVALEEMRRDRDRETHRAVVARRALENARERLDGLERAQDRFFGRLVSWQSLAGADREQVDLAEFIAELRGEIVRLSERFDQEASAAEADAPALEVPAPATEPPVEPQVEPQPPGGAPPSAVSAPSRPPAGVWARRLREAASPEVRRHAARNLAEHAHPEAVPALRRAMRRATDRLERAEMIGLLGQVGGVEASAALDREAESRDPLIQAAVLAARVTMANRDPAARDALIADGLQHPEPVVRRRAILAAVASPSEGLERLVAPHLRDPDGGVRQAANAALARRSARRRPPGTPHTRTHR